MAQRLHLFRLLVSCVCVLTGVALPLSAQTPPDEDEVADSVIHTRNFPSDSARIALQGTRIDTMIAHRIAEAVTLDGNLNEDAWTRATRITNFTQRELREGDPATERTEIAALYDDTFFYIGLWCYDRQPESLIANRLKRDFEFYTEENVNIVIDTYGDKRNGYVFVVNPNGARADVQVLDNGASYNLDWNGVWDAEARITAEGWFAEVKIPFTTLKFRTMTAQVWGINFERNIRHKREQVTWQGWSRNNSVEQVTRAGTLVGITGIESRNFIELKPFVTSGIQSVPREENLNENITSVLRDVGGDLNYLITPTLKLNLTANTDFAQVEADQAQINLSRFPLFFPEKREFFLEGQDYFNFGFDDLVGFYSRRIGITPEGVRVPILGGARIIGKESNSTLGALVMQTAEVGATPSTTYSALSFRQDVFAQSTVGLTATGKFEPNRTNAVYGANARYETATFLGDKNLKLGGAIAQSHTSDAAMRTGDAETFFIEYPNDFLNVFAVWERTGLGFNPEMGFLSRTDNQRLEFGTNLNPRPPESSVLGWIRQLYFSPFNFELFLNDRTKDLESFSAYIQPLAFSTRSGEYLEAFIVREADVPTEAFEIGDGFVIPAGSYWQTRYGADVGTFEGRSVSGFIGGNAGNFYTGTRTSAFGNISWRINKHFNLSVRYNKNFVELPEGGFQTNQLISRAEFALNPKLFGSLFAQWNDGDNNLFFNFRVNWIPVIGTDFFFVCNQQIDTSDSNWKLSGTTVLAKLVWRFVF